MQTDFFDHKEDKSNLCSQMTDMDVTAVLLNPHDKCGHIVKGLRVNTVLFFTLNSASKHHYVHSCLSDFYLDCCVVTGRVLCMLPAATLFRH